MGVANLLEAIRERPLKIYMVSLNSREYINNVFTIILNSPFQKSEMEDTP